MKTLQEIKKNIKSYYDNPRILSSDMAKIVEAMLDLTEFIEDAFRTEPIDRLPKEAPLGIAEDRDLGKAVGGEKPEQPEYLTREILACYLTQKAEHNPVEALAKTIEQYHQYTPELVMEAIILAAFG